MKLTLITTLIVSFPIFCHANCVEELEKTDMKRSDTLLALKCIEQTRVSPANLPVGTIVASMLAPRDFTKEVGDPAAFNSKVSRWALADGREVVDSKYRSAAVATQLPDLRGMFLRGVNAGRKDGKQDPDADRAAGSMQDDELESHSHSLGLGMHGLQNGKGNGNLETGRPPVNTQPAGGAETRPRNVAVYYYVKIN